MHHEPSRSIRKSAERERQVLAEQGPRDGEKEMNESTRIDTFLSSIRIDKETDMGIIDKTSSTSSLSDGAFANEMRIAEARKTSIALPSNFIIDCFPRRV